MSILDKMVKDGDGRFWGFLGCRYIKGSNQEVQIALTAGEHHTNSMGIIHGGVLTSLMDQAMGMVATAAMEVDGCVTTNLNVHFLAPMRQGELIVTSSVLHQAGRSITTQSEVRDESGTLGCMATATFRVAKPRG
ncbi:PaaI family thioesterase [Paenibacillus silvae]|uniref:PaaI family thioesterase n=1 Tax=Paenibacillus TaxID=44249 RepID=UPI0011A0FA86|nr:MULTISPECIES: PaaI family thioesterase [Paenibacillus]MCK6073968.1 PaaI family thioesterase [Paenibacillus silvae]MCK6148554.1 PaaI family thioesterase [Paenibacillus silvae]MCK6266855.1 PaaI family thioesterase [Paenibacillus silvae]